MKRFPLLAFLLLYTAGFGLGAQDPEAVLSKANQQYVLYESAKNSNSAEMYDHLYQSYSLYTSLLETHKSPAVLEADRAKDCIVLLNMIYLSRHNYVEQERILKKAVAEYPNTLDFHYNLINLYITTKTMPT